MKRPNQTESPVFVVLCVLCFQRFFDSFLLLFYSAVAGVVPCGGRKKSHHSAGYILFPWGSLSASWLF